MTTPEGFEYAQTVPPPPPAPVMQTPPPEDYSAQWDAYWKAELKSGRMTRDQLMFYDDFHRRANNALVDRDPTVIALLIVGFMFCISLIGLPLGIPMVIAAIILWNNKRHGGR
jgi:hypothetical protein